MNPSQFKDAIADSAIEADWQEASARPLDDNESKSEMARVRDFAKRIFQRAHLAWISEPKPHHFIKQDDQPCDIDEPPPHLTPAEIQDILNSKGIAQDLHPNLAAAIDALQYAMVCKFRCIEDQYLHDLAQCRDSVLNAFDDWTLSNTAASISDPASVPALVAEGVLTLQQAANSTPHHQSAAPKYQAWLHKREHGQWPEHIDKSWMLDACGRYNDSVVTTAIIDELAQALSHKK